MHMETAYCISRGLMVKCNLLKSLVIRNEIRDEELSTCPVTLALYQALASNINIIDN